MQSVGLILSATAVFAASGLPAYALRSRPLVGQRLTTTLMILASALGLTGAVAALGERAPNALRTGWWLPFGEFSVEVDAISLVFLLPVFVVPTLGSIYALAYWRETEHPENGKRLALFYGLMAAAITLVLVARDGALFLVAWEIMALAAYFALVTESEKPEVRRVGWLYFTAAHVGTLGLFALFALWKAATGSFALVPATGLGAETANALFLLALLAFGFKAGLFPMHFWLPGAHAAAPSHLSAVMSGVLLKTGIYGLVRMIALLPAPPEWWGWSLLLIGAVSGLAGIAFAIVQTDIKKLLAYSSVENIGIVVMGLGLAVLGLSDRRGDWVALGLVGALFHVWNHALFKALLFLNAGAVLHATATREIDRLGGLAARMPLSAGLFAIGAVAICALPPLNGFAGEWLLYLGFLRTLGVDHTNGRPAVAALCVVLATIGALAVACFVKVFGAVYLGAARGPLARRGHDPSASMLAPMITLAAVCVGLGLLPTLALGPLEAAARRFAATSGVEPQALATLADPSWITRFGLLLIGLGVFLGAVVYALVRRRPTSRAVTWDCGYARPSARMQYTGSSLTAPLAELMRLVLGPRRILPSLGGLFARAARFRTRTPDLVLDRGLAPAAARILRFLPWVRRLHQGSVHLYIAYVLATIVILFLLAP